MNLSLDSLAGAEDWALLGSYLELPCLLQCYLLLRQDQIAFDALRGIFSSCSTEYAVALVEKPGGEALGCVVDRNLGLVISDDEILFRKNLEACYPTGLDSEDAMRIYYVDDPARLANLAVEEIDFFDVILPRHENSRQQVEGIETFDDESGIWNVAVFWPWNVGRGGLENENETAAGG